MLLQNEAILKEEKLTNPALILKQLNYAVKKNLKLDTGDSLSNEGMDAAACLILPDEGKLIYAGARIPLICIFNNDIIIKKADKRSIGYKESRRSDINYNFKNHEIIIEKGMSFYLATDGFADQFGGPKGKKYTFRRFKQTLLSIADLSMEMQEKKLLRTLYDWQGTVEQVDDILVFIRKHLMVEYIITGEPQRTERFDYPIFMYEAEKVGITATGEEDQNELYPNSNQPEDIEKTCLEWYRDFLKDPKAFAISEKVV